MKKLTTVAVGAMLALSLCACTSAPVDTGSAEAAANEQGSVATSTSEVSYTYDGIEEWDEPAVTPNGENTLHDVMDPMAKQGTDMEAFAHSELGEYAVSSSYLNRHIGDVASPEVTSYWAERGMIHELHDADDQDRQWTSLVPDDYDPSKSYPLVFVWHGTGNPILLAVV